ncbi:MAG: PorP/SprF family type IX secretion system membrane protein, partial [Bacteroidota bacterium]
MKRLSIIAALFFTLCQAMAQDIRYSQFFNNPLTFNPALTGSGIENLRATLSYRRQEAGPATPFATKGFAIDKSIGRFGLGFTVNSNGAGDASIKTLQLAGSLSYGVPFGYKGSNRITAGLQLGAINKSLNPSKLTFDNQFNEDLGYDPNISSGETFENTSIIRPGLNMGLFWKRDGRKKDNVKPFLGYGLMNVNRPDVSFFGEDVRIPIKHVIHAGADIRINDELIVKPNVYHFEQGPFNETGFGVLGAYRNHEHHEIQGGVFGKAGKAMVVYAGYQIDRFLVGMRYDVMTGQVREAGRGYGAFELSLT